MNLKCVNLTDKNKETLQTEILYSITEAKALRVDVLKLCFDFKEEKLVRFLDKFLKSIKKEGFIQLSVSSSDMQERTTGAEYLYNLYSELESVETDSKFWLIKL